MVLQKRLDYELNGHPVQIKRGARSARRRATFQRRVEDNQMCAFDLLATIAGDLLLHEKENPFISSEKLSEKDQRKFFKEECQDASETFKAKLSDEDCDKRCQHGFVKECQDANNSFKGELSDEGSSDLKCFSNLSLQPYNESCCFKEPLRPEIDGHSHIASMVTNSSCSERVATEMVGGKNHDEVENLNRKVKLGFCRSPEISDNKLDGDVKKVKDELLKFDKAPVDTGTKMCCSEDPLAEKPLAQISSGGNAKLSCSSLSVGCNNVPVVSRDDDENFSGCAHPTAKSKSFMPLTHVGDHSIRKTLAAKYCKVAQQSKHDTHSNCVLNGNLKPIYSSRKNCYKRQRSQKNIPFKKRKFFNYSSVSKSNGFVRSGDTYYSPGNDKKKSTSKASHDHAMSSLEAHQHSALGSRDSHVKLRIKSFRVPELFIEIPETATVGSLKKSVMEAVTAVLGGGLRVGVILQGKKVRDDSKTLLQTGISHDNHLDALGFALEPISSQGPPPLCSADSLHGPSADMPQPLTRYPSSSAVINHRSHGCSDVLPEPQVTSLGNLVESDHDSAPSPINTSVEKNITDSKALVTVPEMGMEALAMLPVQQKSKRSETVQRRIRRPFSVAEVEALVQAVEKLGTGRWRDVKLRAFDNAKHRTYVDLKDKWKTLVHTARISPQQRRGEPVPQELLDRVLTAHAFWSQQQLKHQPETCLLLQ